MNWPPEGIDWYYSDDAVAIAHGDCRDILPTLPKVDLVLTDPPYGIRHSSNHGASWQSTEIAGDWDTTLRDYVLEEMVGTPMFVFSTWKAPLPVQVVDLKGVLVWDKGPAFGMGDLKFPWKNSWEMILVVPGDVNIFIGSRDEGVLKGHIQVSWESKGRQHPNQKPESLCRYLINKTTAQLILDPFIGSGTTLVAAKDLGRKAIGIEIEEKYCEIAARRMSQSVMSLEV